MQDHQPSVTLTRTVSDRDGESRFETARVVLHSEDPDDPPLTKSAVIPATSISFRSTPGNYAFDFHTAPRRRLIVLLEGKLEVVTSLGDRRVFEVGDVLEVNDTTGKGHISRAVDGQPFRSAFINVDYNLVTSRVRPADNAQDLGSVKYLRTFDGDDGRSRTQPGQLPYRHAGPSGRVTDEIPISGFQFVWASSNLDYSWHRAPQRQFVIPIIGGMDIENGHGERHLIRTGELYVGEDTSGRGHLMRALDGMERLSIFAHLHGSLTDCAR